MYFISAVALLAGIATALPQPSSTIDKRAGLTNACATEPDGYGPTPYPNDAYHFVRFGTFSTVSTVATAPNGYQRTFHNHLQATQGTGYMGLYQLKSYDVSGCSGLCDGTIGCKGFNIYYERDPTVNPGPACTNPTSMTNYKCTLWSYPPTVVNATNVGETRSNFTVVMAGSNGFARLGSVSSTLPDDGTNPYS